VKIMYDDSNGKIMGAMIIGEHASEMIHEMIAAMEAGMTVDRLSNVLHGHPTLSELIGDALFHPF
jgi:dihydrolipoamide dehydrogenase